MAVAEGPIDRARERPARGAWGPALAVLAFALASAAAVLAGNGALGVALAPAALLLVVVAVVQLPLRDTLPVLALACLVLENPGEIPAAGVWESPLHTVGALLLAHVNKTFPVKALVFSGVDLLVILFSGVLVFRIATRSEVDGPRVPPASPLVAAAVASLVAVLWTWASGMARGGNFNDSLWQVARVIYLPPVLLLFASALRGPSDARRLGILLLAAALLRATVAIYVRHLFPDEKLVPYTTTHADSMLFADAVLLVLAVLLERLTPRTLALAAITLPILSWGMLANARRLAWVEVGLGALVILWLARWSRVKRWIARSVVVALPAIMLYVAAGWGSSARIFEPVRTIRSVVDSGSDASTAWRDLENYDLYATFRRHPLLGKGYGHGYDEVIRLPDISGAFALYRHIPHNSILGLFAFAGLAGFTVIWMFVPIGIFLAVRSYRMATEPRDRIAALAAVATIVTYLVHVYGDMGLGTWTSVFTVGPALGLVAKVATAVGAWPARRAASRAAPADDAPAAP